MNERDPQQYPGSQHPGPGAAVAALLLGLVAGAAALLLATKPGQRLMAQVSDRAEDWKAQAAAAVAETREKVVTSVEAEAPPASDSGPSDSGPSDGGQRVREYL